MGSLSNRVMNMKFMQSDVKYQKESEENYSKNIKDDSEWISPYYHQYLTKVKPKNVEYIGYANINDIESNDIQNSETGHGFRNGNPGRKVWGDNTIDEKAILDISKLKDTIFKNNKNEPRGNNADKGDNASQKATSETQTNTSDDNVASKSEKYLDDLMGKSNKRDNSSVGGDKGKPGARKKRKGGSKKTR